MLSKEVLEEWREHPTTKLVLAGLRIRQQELQAHLSSGQTLGDRSNPYQICLKTAETVGKIAGIEEILNIQSEE